MRLESVRIKSCEVETNETNYDESGKTRGILEKM